MSLFQCLGVVMILQVGIAKTGKEPPEASLRSLQSQGNAHTARVVLIFSQSWSSHGLEVSATDDPRQAATKLTIKLCRFRA